MNTFNIKITFHSSKCVLLYKTSRSSFIKRKIKSNTPSFIKLSKDNLQKGHFYFEIQHSLSLKLWLLYTFCHFPVLPTTLSITFKRLEALSVSSFVQAVFTQRYFSTSLGSSPRTRQKLFFKSHQLLSGLLISSTTGQQCCLYRSN